MKPLQVPTGRNRSETLLADYKEPLGSNDLTFAKGWSFAVTHSFRDALDIKLTELIKKGKKEKVWTQGRNISFKEGDIVHDHPTAYIDTEWDKSKPYTWDQATRKIHITLQVVNATPSVSTTNGNSSADGQVQFLIFVKEPGTCKLEMKDDFHCTQIEFVRLLRDGKFYELETGILVDVFQKYPKE